MALVLALLATFAAGALLVGAAEPLVRRLAKLPFYAVLGICTSVPFVVIILLIIRNAVESALREGPRGFGPGGPGTGLPFVEVATFFGGCVLGGLLLLGRFYPRAMSVGAILIGAVGSALTMARPGDDFLMLGLVFIMLTTAGLLAVYSIPMLWGAIRGEVGNGHAPK